MFVGFVTNIRYGALGEIERCFRLPQQWYFHFGAGNISYHKPVPYWLLIGSNKDSRTKKQCNYGELISSPECWKHIGLLTDTGTDEVHMYLARTV